MGAKSLNVNFGMSVTDLRLLLIEDVDFVLFWEISGVDGISNDLVYNNLSSSGITKSSYCKSRQIYLSIMLHPPVMLSEDSREFFLLGSASFFSTSRV
jgi:hypothetical protein